MYTLIASQLGNIHIIDLCIEYTHHGVRVFGFYPVAMVIIDTTKRKCTCTVVEQLHDNKSLMGKLGHGIGSSLILVRISNSVSLHATLGIILSTI